MTGLFLLDHPRIFESVKETLELKTLYEVTIKEVLVSLEYVIGAMSGMLYSLKVQSRPELQFNK